MSGRSFPGAGPHLVADAAALGGNVTRLARSISVDHPRGVVLVGVLKGSMVFLADLARQLSVPASIEFVAVAPFDGSAGRTQVVKDVDRPLAGESVVLVNGIMDTGLTTNFLLGHLASAEPASVRLATMVDKQARRIVPLSPDYAGLTAPDHFLIGYGLDYRGRYRNLASLWAVDGSALRDDPDRHVADLYPQAARPASDRRR